MTLPKPQSAPEADLAAIFAQQWAREAQWQQRASIVQAQAAQAYARLLDIAETSDTGQAARIARFIAATFNGHAFHFDLFDLRALDVALSEDVLLCIDALRWAKADLFTLVPNGEARVKSILNSWDIQPSNP